MRRAVLLLAIALSGSLLMAAGPVGQNFHTQLSGDQEVGPVDTRARGEAYFQLNSAGDEIAFRLIASNIEAVTQAHIHCGSAGINGPVRVFLFGFVPGGVDSNGVLSEGTFDPTGITCPDSTSLVDSMRAGNTYVNVHTEAHPGGEIRGQIQAGGPKS